MRRTVTLIAALIVGSSTLASAQFSGTPQEQAACRPDVGRFCKGVKVEQGNMLKAADFLEKIEAICGNKTCQEYQDLKGGMEGTVTY